MEYFCGLDISIETTALCVVDSAGTIVCRVSVATDPEAIYKQLKPYLSKLKRVGHEAGSLSPWLHPQLLAKGLPVVCLETHHVRNLNRPGFAGGSDSEVGWSHDSQDIKQVFT